MTDVDGTAEDRSDTISVFNGPPPVTCSLRTENEETATVGKWIAERTRGDASAGVQGLCSIRCTTGSCTTAVRKAGSRIRFLDDEVASASNQISISTMHLAKGLEFRAVAVMACDDEIIPLQGRIETVGDDADLQAIFTISSATYFMSPAPAHAITSWSRALSRYLSSWMTS